MDSSPVAIEQPPTIQPDRQRYMLAGGLVALVLMLVGAGLILGQEVGHFVETGMPYIIFMVLALVGTLGLTQNWARWTTYGVALLLQGLVGLFTFNVVVLSLLEGPINLNDPAALADALPPSALITIGLTVGGLVLLFLACSLVLIPQVQHWLTRWIPINPQHYTHSIALWVMLFITTSAAMQLILLGGYPPLLTAITSGALGEELGAGRGELGQSLTLIYGLIWMLPLALVAAGWPLRRTFRATLTRLGLVIPTWRQVGFGLLFAIGLAIVIGFFGQGISTIWNWFGWPETDTAAFEQLLGGLVSPLGAVVIGVTAGLGEELAVRGLLQPRLGLLFSNLAFTAVHAYQYGFDGLATVFILGMLLGVVRARSNTTTAAIVHGTYNALVVLMALAGV